VEELKLLGVADISQSSLYAADSPVAGRLQLFLKNWEAITKDRWVLEAVAAYKIDWCAHPHQQFHPADPQFSEEEEVWMGEEIEAMLQKGAIEKVENPGDGFVSTMFLVPKKDGGRRPVINLKRLNGFVKTEHFKMEGIHMLKSVLKKGDWMAKIDLKDAYFVVPITNEDRRFLRFRWKRGTYQFTCLPFGLSCAPWVFTKITKAMTSCLRHLGLRMIIYIDDILLLAEDETTLRNHTTALIYLLENLGFIINQKKSNN